MEGLLSGQDLHHNQWGGGRLPPPAVEMLPPGVEVELVPRLLPCGDGVVHLLPQRGLIKHKV